MIAEEQALKQDVDSASTDELEAASDILDKAKDGSLYIGAKLMPYCNHGFPLCPECKIGYYGCLMAYASCDNPNCKLYNKFYMAKCGICKNPRRQCCC